MSSRPPTGDDLLILARIFCAATGVGWGEISRTVGSPGLLSKIEASVPVHAEVIDRALSYFARHWPDDLRVTWPHSIPRPRVERFTPRPGIENYRERRM